MDTNQVCLYIFCETVLKEKEEFQRIGSVLTVCKATKNLQSTAGPHWSPLIYLWADLCFHPWRGHFKQFKSSFELVLLYQYAHTEGLVLESSSKLLAPPGSFRRSDPYSALSELPLGYVKFAVPPSLSPCCPQAVEHPELLDWCLWCALEGQPVDHLHSYVRELRLPVTACGLRAHPHQQARDGAPLLLEAKTCKLAALQHHTLWKWYFAERRGGRV